MNEIYDSMLSAYDLSTEQQMRNAIFEVNQRLYLQDCIMADSLMSRRFMEALA